MDSGFWNELYAELDGHAYTHDGVSGTLKVSRFGRLCHEADEAGRVTEKYKAARRCLRDDYITDMDDSIVDIAYELRIIDGDGNFL